MHIQIKKNILIPTVLLSGLSLITSGLIILAACYNANHYVFTYAPAAYEETADALDNPYCGWYQMYGYTLSDHIPISAETIDRHKKDSAGCQLALLEINLQNYVSGELSDTALSQLEQILSSWEQSRHQLIVRFLYDWNGHAALTEPQSVQTILNHMNQTAAVVNRHTSSVYLMQGIFVGNYGEMHGSVHLTDASVRMLAQRLSNVTDPSVYLSVRTPQHWRTIAQSFEPLSAPASGFGLFNDGMLGSATDLGTYGSSRHDILPAAKAASDFTAKGARAEELAFQNALCDWVPNGGEVVMDNPYNDFDAAVRTLRDMHVSYLSKEHDKAVLQKWELASYDGDDCFQGMNGLDYIGRHLGYRFTITDSSLTYDRSQKGPAVLELTVANRGFSSCYRALTAELIFLHTQTGESQTFPLDTDTRHWLADSETTVSVPINGRDYAPGNYTVWLRLTDPVSHRQIQLANTLQADHTFGYPIATLQIMK